MHRMRTSIPRCFGGKRSVCDVVSAGFEMIRKDGAAFRENVAKEEARDAA
jgi:hypothetical protein